MARYTEVKRFCFSYAFRPLYANYRKKLFKHLNFVPCRAVQALKFHVLFVVTELLDSNGDFQNAWFCVVTIFPATHDLILLLS